MRSFLLTVFTVFCLFIVQAQKTWVGLNGNWSVGSNWSGGTAPLSTDDVVFNTSVTVTLDVAPNVNSIKIVSPASVTLASSVSRNITVSSTAVNPKGLEIQSGAGLTIDATATGSTTCNINLQLTGSAGVSGLINGNLYFTCSGGSTGGGGRLDTFSGALAYADLQVGSTGYIKYFSNTGNTASSATSITMQNGSTYEIAKNGGSFPNGIWNSGSLCKSTGMVANGPFFNGTTYGNLEWNNNSQTSVFPINKDLSFNNITILNTNGNALRVKTGNALSSFTLTINGILSLSAGTILETSGTTVLPAYGGTIELKGNLINNGTLTETGPAGTLDTLSFSGTTAQTISGTGTYTNQLTVKINNSAGVSLSTPVSLPHTLRLANGLLNTTAVNLLTVSQTAALNPFSSANGSFYTNLNGPPSSKTNFGNESSYINGPVKINITGTVYAAFPVGDATIFRPFFLRNASGNFTGQYFKVNPYSFGLTLGAGLDHISSVEHWEITGTGSPSAEVELSYYDPNSGGVTSMPDLRVAHWNGTQWDDAGQVLTYGTAGANGSVISTTQTSFSPFTLASSSVLNPLPEQSVLLSFIAGNSGFSNLRWVVTGDQTIKEYTVQKSTDKMATTDLATIPSMLQVAMASYSFRVFSENNYYRIKAVLQNGARVYSNWVNGIAKQKMPELFPNPVVNELRIFAYNPLELEIFDWKAASVLRKNLPSGTSVISLNKFPSGYYSLRLTSQTDKSVQTGIFIKN